jgi:hypothetical protein
MLLRFDLAGRECLAADHNRRFTQHDLDILPGEIAPVEHAEIAELALRAGADIALAEIVLAAGVHGQIGRQVLAVLLEKTEQPAPMVEMTVAHDQRIDLGRIDLQELHVAVDGIGRPAEVEQEGLLLVAALRLDIKREPPLAVQRAPGVGRATGLGPDSTHLLWPEEEVARTIDQDPHAELVDGRHLDRPGLGHLDTGETRSRGCQRHASG